MSGEITFAAQRPAARDPLELAKLLQRVDPDVRVRADADPDASLAHALDGEEAVAEVRLGRRADADAGVGLRDEVELASSACVAWTTVVRGPRQPVSGEELDRADAVLLDALVDLPRLLVGVDVERQLVLLGVAADLLEPVGRAGADGVGGEADLDAALAEVLDLVQVLVRTRLAEAVEPAARVGDVEEDERDAGRVGGLRGGERLLEAEVVELADRGVAGGAHLAVDLLVARCGRAPEVCSSARASIASRQAQKSPPSVRPRSARWNAWLCALTKPGIVSRFATGAH